MRSIRRKIKADRWDIGQINAVNSFPWKPYEGSEDDKILIKPPTAAVPRNLTDDQVQRSRLGEPTPRPFAIQRRDLINYGYTPGCQGVVTLLPITESTVHTPMSVGEESKTQWPKMKSETIVSRQPVTEKTHGWRDKCVKARSQQLQIDLNLRRQLQQRIQIVQCQYT